MLLTNNLFEYSDIIAVWEVFKKQVTLDSNLYEKEDWVSTNIKITSTDPKSLSKRDEAAQAYSNGITEVATYMELFVKLIPKEMESVISGDYSLMNVFRTSREGCSLPLYNGYYRLLNSQLAYGVLKEQILTLYKLL
jgi:hypothetical protein